MKAPTNYAGKSADRGDTQPVAPLPEKTLENSADLVVVFAQVYDYANQRVVLMRDPHSGIGYLVNEADVDLRSTEPQRVDLNVAIQPYQWQVELTRLVPDVESVRRTLQESFWHAGVFDKSGLQTNSAKNMFDLAFPYRRQFFDQQE